MPFEVLKRRQLKVSFFQFSFFFIYIKISFLVPQNLLFFILVHIGFFLVDLLILTINFIINIMHVSIFQLNNDVK